MAKVDTNVSIMGQANRATMLINTRYIV